MEIKKYTVNIRDNEFNFDFVCESRNTRHGFAHDCTVFLNGREYGRATCHYLNRTWEYYRYQTVTIKAVNDMIDTVYKRIENDTKQAHEWKKITAKRRAAVDIRANQNFYYAALTELLELVKAR